MSDFKREQENEIKTLKNNILYIVLFAMLLACSLFAVDTHKQKKATLHENIDLKTSIVRTNETITNLKSQVLILTKENTKLKEHKDITTTRVIRKDGSSITKTRFKSTLEKDSTKDGVVAKNDLKDQLKTNKDEQNQALDAVRREESEETEKKTSNFRWLMLAISVVAIAIGVPLWL